LKKELLGNIPNKENIMFIWKLDLFFFIRNHLPRFLSPAEGIEHVEEGDGDVDEDDQGEQGV
jgi:hypothetical protein